jgi:hypothetical protein
LTPPTPPDWDLWTNNDEAVSIGHGILTEEDKSDPFIRSNNNIGDVSAVEKEIPAVSVVGSVDNLLHLRTKAKDKSLKKRKIRTWEGIKRCDYVSYMSL